MSQTKTETLKYSNGWGIPGWEDGSAYPDPKTTTDLQWKWEFLRRRNDYREDWEKYALETFEKMTKNGGSNPTHTIKLLFDIEKYPKSFSSTDDLDFLAEMPGSKEKYGLHWLPNPSTPTPEFLYFYLEPLRGIKHDCGAEGVGDYWGVRYTVFPYEIVFRFDLSVLPVWRLIDQLTTKSLLSEEIQEECNLRDKSHASWLDILCSCSDESERNYWRTKRKGKSDPRYLIDPQDQSRVHVIINKIQPLGPQVSHVKKMLEGLQKRSVGKIPNRRCDPFTWQSYLRVLDARQLSRETGKPLATYAEIGWELLELDKKNRFTRFVANSRGKQMYQDALRLQQNFPS